MTPENGNNFTSLDEVMKSASRQLVDPITDNEEAIAKIDLSIDEEELLDEFLRLYYATSDFDDMPSESEKFLSRLSLWRDGKILESISCDVIGDENKVNALYGFTPGRTYLKLVKKLSKCESRENPLFDRLSRVVEIASEGVKLDEARKERSAPIEGFSKVDNAFFDKILTDFHEFPDDLIE